MKNIKKYFLLIVYIISPFLIKAQIVQSSCEAPDSIIFNYNRDAANLTFEYIYQINDGSIDSIELPQVYREKFLDAIIATLNATELEVVDTVFYQYDIHTFPFTVLDRINLSVDKLTIWYQELRDGNIPTGYLPIDSLIEKYSLTVESIFEYGDLFNYHTITFQIGDHKNVNQFVKLFEGLEGVIYSLKDHSAGDGNNIEGTIDNEDVSLIFSRGWGDCPSGCIYRKYWEFKVYSDCSVEYIGSYGDFVSNINPSIINYSIFPNPFDNEIYIEGNMNESEFILYNVNGQIVRKGIVTQNVISGLSELSKQIYILTLKKNQESSSKLLIKK